MALDPAEKKEVQINFQGWLEIQDRRKELTDENKTLMEETANILGVEKPLVVKAFRALKRKVEDGHDEVEDLYNVMTEIGA